MVSTTTKCRPSVRASSQASTSASTSGSSAASSPASQAAPAVISHQPPATTEDREVLDQERARASGTTASSTSRANVRVEPSPTTTSTSTSTSTGIFPPTPNPTRFAPSQRPPSSKALGKRRQSSPDASSLPSPTSLSLGTSTSQPPRPDRKGGRKRIKPSRDQTHSINGPKLAPGAGLRSKKRNVVLPEEQASTDGSKPSAMVLKDRRKEFLKKIRETKGVEGEKEEEDWSVEKIRSVKASLLEQIQAELDQIQQEYKTLSDELVKAQIEESVWNNVKKETLAERTHLRYLNKGQLMNLLTNPRPT
ncbi:BZ3500_MvSof-1268-A1-R1_Chr3-2g06317 [Microbotryum saponariae]|uniref:BZ3500_MvSof-1268-A1-R1_Chr3-2g06317 protein n=1 Tax=Microbotryum saponariae TaxID=289078 RepID=A0A2X0LH18_9BASI|nr:BZ3500_MvSof-1268-A1-R1_Chr3-2g06317 [Microbotryum saponariae]SDA04288.1 BZ3501_MvSof-1269-A2-R1_Chr3-2g06008 [Microbotryum saponariae]